MLLELGANDYNYGLFSACHRNQIELVKMMLSLGANNYDDIKLYGNLELKIIKEQIETFTKFG